MKVVLFCGGLGTRLREHSDTIPKPLVTVGPRPIIWHLMRYYAHYGHREFVLALGYRGDMIREFFLKYEEFVSNDFKLTLSGNGKRVDLFSNDLQDLTITFVDTGMHSNLGQRLVGVRKHLGNDEMFLANYADGLSDLPLESYIAEFKRRAAIGSFIGVRPRQSFHYATTDNDGMVTALESVGSSGLWLNGGFFCMRREIFDYIKEGEGLVEQPFSRLIAARRLWSPRHDGFWQAMDTFKDKITFDRMEARGECPWMVWRKTDAQPRG